MRVDLHARVLTREAEPAGHVQHAVLDPETNEITDFVVSTGDVLGKDVVVPASEFDQADAEGGVVRVRLTHDELDQLPPYVPAEYDVPPSDWTPPATTFPYAAFPYAAFLWPVRRPESEVPPTTREPWEAPQEVLVDKGTVVVDRDGHDVGVVEDVVMEPERSQVRSFDIRLGGALRTLFPGGDTVRIGMEQVDSVEETCVHLRIKKEELKQKGDRK